ncbi:MAG: TolC family protein [Myxococcota bacterium]|nr:TolC family protein [Myxococcota bacterium]
MRRMIAVLLPLALGIAPSAQGGDTPDAGAGRYTAPTLHGELRLSLAEAISMGLENNLGIEIERHAPLIAHEDHEASWGSYDPEWVTEFGYSDDRQLNSSSLIGPTTPEFFQKVTGGEGGITGMIPWLNTQLSALVGTEKTETNAQFQELSPDFTTGLTLIGRQPLLRGLIWNEPWTAVKTTGVLYRVSLEELRRELMDTVTQIEGGYWALIADEERVNVALKSLETAQALLEQVTTQYQVGVVSKVEIAEAEAGVAARDFELIRAQNRYRDRMDRVINLVLGPNLTADSRISIEPTDRPDDYIVYDIDVEQAVQIAFHNRPELSIAQREIDRLELNLRFAKTQRLPQFDIEARWAPNGRAGQANPDGGSPPLDDLVGNWGDSFDLQSNSWGVRGILTVPIGNVAGRHNVSKAELELRRAHVQKKRVEQDIILNVRAAARDLTSSQEGIEAAERRQVAATEQLRAEEIRLEYGESTPFDVLLREQDLVAADQEFIEAVEVYRSSVTGLDRAQGTILRNRNIDIEQAARLR